MNTKFYQFLMVLVAAALLIGCAGAAYAQTATPGAQPATAVNRTLTVNGSGQVYMAPDIAYITIGVHTEGPNAADAVAENSAQTEDVIDALKAAGIAEADLRTNNFSIFPQQRFDDQGKPTGEVTYSVDNSVLATIRDVESVGDILDTAVSAGSNSISGIQFDVENKDEAMEAARNAAVTDARAKAQSLAEAAGVELGDVQAITEFSSGGPQPMYDMRASVAAESPASVPVQPGQMLLSLDVNMVFTIR